MTIYDLPGRLHPPFEPVVIEDVPITRTMQLGRRVVLRTPYFLKTEFSYAFFEGGSGKYGLQLISRVFDDEVRAIFRSRVPPPHQEWFEREVQRKLRELGDRVLQTVHQLAESRVTLYRHQPEGIPHAER